MPRFMSTAKKRAPIKRLSENERALLGKITDREFARIFNRPLRAVYQFRRRLGIPQFRGNQPPKRPRKPWTPAEDRMVGRDSDAAIGRLLDREKVSVRRRRVALGIPTNFRRRIKWTPDLDAMLGVRFDTEVAAIVGCSVPAVGVRRRRLGIPRRVGFPGRWAKKEISLLGILPDSEIAEQTGRSLAAVKTKRRSLGILYR